MLLSSSPPTSLQQPSANSSFTSVEETLQASNSLGQFNPGSTRIPKTSVHDILSSSAVKSVSNPKQDDKSTTRNNKIHQLAVLYAKWAYEDKEEPVEGKELVGRQRQRCKAIGLVVFGFTLHKKQIDAILCLFYRQTDLLLLAKTGLEKASSFSSYHL